MISSCLIRVAYLVRARSALRLTCLTINLMQLSCHFFQVLLQILQIGEFRWQKRLFRALGTSILVRILPLYQSQLVL